MRLFYTLLNYFLFGNWFIGFCAFAFTSATYLQFDLPFLGNYNLPLFICFSTVFIYSFHGYVIERKGSIDKRNCWLDKNRTLLLLNIFISLLAAGYTFLKISPLGLIVLVPSAMVSLLYSRSIKICGYVISLRELAFSKNVLIGSVWGVVTVVLPALTEGIHYNERFFLAVAEKIFFITALCVPFDIRDNGEDQAGELKTFPSEFGIRKAKFIAFFILLIFMVLSSLVNGYLFALVVTAFSFFFIALSDKMKDYFYNIYGDGLLILYLLLYWVINM